MLFYYVLAALSAAFTLSASRAPAIWEFVWGESAQLPYMWLVPVMWVFYFVCQADCAGLRARVKKLEEARK